MTDLEKLKKTFDEIGVEYRERDYTISNAGGEVVKYGRSLIIHENAMEDFSLEFTRDGEYDEPSFWTAY